MDKYKVELKDGFLAIVPVKKPSQKENIE